VSRAPLAVTVSGNQAQALAQEARARAAEWGLPFFPRPSATSLEEARHRLADALLVLSARGWRLEDPQGALSFSPGMAMVRIKRLQHGVQQPDQLLRHGEVRAGDVVVDATVGLGADLLVAAHTVGPTGRVHGIEASLPLYALVSQGLKRGGLPGTPGPISLHHGLAREVLATMETGSADCVFLDPMFDKPLGAAEAFSMLRRYARAEPLDEETLREAQRVARRWVVVKANHFGKALRLLGLVPEPARRSAPTMFARLPGTQRK
jgi:16S rRNA (guanine1516-N2)-methyltransferase